MTRRVNINKVPCPLCSRLMHDDTGLKRHMKMHENTCTDCGKRFSSSSKLSEHQYRAHVRHVCNQCGKSYRSPQDLQRHIDTVHLKIKKYSCHLCDGKFSDPTPLRLHIMRHKADPNIKIKCTMCEKTFSLQYQLDQHFRLCHTSKGRVNCDQCEKDLSASSLSEHRKIFHSDLSFTCKDCGKTFKHKDYLRKHRQLHTKNLLEKEFKCDQCDKAYDNQDYLRKHKRYIHDKSEVGKWECKQCGKTYAQSGGLFLHKKTHEKTKEFKCTDCGKEFYLKSVLKRHLFCHEKSLPFPCLLCKKSFYRQSELDDHQGMHTGIKPYNCDKCGNGYVNKENWKNHKCAGRKIMKPFNCNKCGKGYSDKKYLKAHNCRGSN